MAKLKKRKAPKAKFLRISLDGSAVQAAKMKISNMFGGDLIDDQSFRRFVTEITNEALYSKGDVVFAAWIATKRRDMSKRDTVGGRYAAKR